jgi:glyoxylase-like metal-dependent hydrolase (beta-lactamase superfamily II)
MYGEMHQKIVDAVRALSPQPIRFVVNTHSARGSHWWQCGDGQAGRGESSRTNNMRKRMVDGAKRPSSGALALMTYANSLTLHFNGEDISIYHPAPAHTDGDSIIYFHKANVVHVGDIPASLRYRNIGVNDGGSVDGMMAAARQLMTVVRPDTKIIPGISDRSSDSRRSSSSCTMFAAVRDRIAAAIKRARPKPKSWRRSRRRTSTKGGWAAPSLRIDSSAWFTRTCRAG